MTRLALLPLLLAPACDRSNRDYIQAMNPDFPPVIHLGELPVIPLADFQDPSLRPDLVTYAILGPPDVASFGGATYTFIGTGGTVCLLVDPEAAFWNQSVSVLSPVEAFAWADNYDDDGDLDMEAGLSAYYTGSPGLEMGDFSAVYEDSLGVEVRIEFNECLQADYYGESGSHAGRATLEFCDIDTSQHPGREYTVALNTYAIPQDDDLLSFGVAVVDGPCTSVPGPGEALDECLIPGEAMDENLQTLDWFPELEAAICANNPASFCEAHPDHCGDPP